LYIQDLFETIKGGLQSGALQQLEPEKEPMTISSVYRCNFAGCIPFPKSLIEIENNTGAKKEPWGTPLSISRNLNFSLSAYTHSVRKIVPKPIYCPFTETNVSESS
jgi:hypothetical protein